MERVLTLCNKLQEQLVQNASIDQMLATVEMLQSELLHLKLQQPNKNEGPVSFHVAQVNAKPQHASQINNGQKEEKTVQVLQVDEAELEAELEEIKRNAQAKTNMGMQNKPALLFDPVEDIPTLTHQQPFIPPVAVSNEKVRAAEVHELISKDQSSSLNDKLKQAKIELGDSLLEVSIKDLRKAIGVNDRFVFINELFRGDEVMYERSIKTINSFAIYPEAEYWIKRELKLKLGWTDQNEMVKQFDQLIKRRFL